MTTIEQRNGVIESRKEIEQGLNIENELLDKEDNTWQSTR